MFRCSPWGQNDTDVNWTLAADTHIPSTPPTQRAPHTTPSASPLISSKMIKLLASCPNKRKMAISLL